MKTQLSNFLWVLLASVVITACDIPSTQDQSAQQEVEDTTQQVVRSLDTQIIENIVGKQGTEDNGEYKITIPQNDLNVMVDGFRINPPMGLGSWAAFSPTAEGAMLMGDIIVGGDEIGPVQKVIIEQGLSVTAIHNHFVRNQPNYMYMHIGGMGSEEKLANGVKAIFDTIQELRGGDPAAAQAATVENTLDTTMITNILGHEGSMNNGVFKVTIGRPDVDLKDHGSPVSTFMGFNTWASWQCTLEKAAVAGDFTMLASEVEPVIKALVEHNIEVVALHNHMVHEEPRIFFLHYWGVGPAEELANGLKAALDQTGKSSE